MGYKYFSVIAALIVGVMCSITTVALTQQTDTSINFESIFYGNSSIDSWGNVFNYDCGTDSTN